MNYDELRIEAEESQHIGLVGIASASQLDALSKCQGMLKRATGMSSLVSEYAIEGSMKHLAAFYDEIPDDAPEDFKEDVQFLLDKRAKLEAEGWEVAAKEKYMELEDENQNVILTGTCDLIMRKGIAYLFVDYKTGKNPVSQETLQLKAYTIMGQKLYHNAHECYAAIWQPCCPDNEPIRIHAPDADREIRGILKNAYDGGECTPNVVSCKYCPALASEMCPAAQEQWKGDIAEIPTTKSLDASKFPEYLKKIAFIEPFIKEIKRKAYLHVLNGGEIEGYTIVNPTKITKVKDASMAYDVVKDRVDLKEFLEHVTIPYTACKNMVKQKDMTKDQLEEYAESMFSNCIKKTDKSGFIKKRPKKY